MDLAGVVASLNIAIASKADSNSVYSQGQINTFLQNLETQSDLASKLSNLASVSALQNTQSQVALNTSSISAIQAQVAADVTQTQLQAAVAPLATQAALTAATSLVSSQGSAIDDLQMKVATAVQPADLSAAVTPLVSKALLDSMVAPLASKADVITAAAPLVKTSDFTAALALKADVSSTHDSLTTVNTALTATSTALTGLQESIATCVHTSDLQLALTPYVSTSLLASTVAPLASTTALANGLAPKANSSDVNASLDSIHSSISTLQTTLATAVQPAALASAVAPLATKDVLAATVAPLASSADLSSGLALKANSVDMQAALALKADHTLVEAELSGYTKVADFAPVQAAQVAATQWIAQSGASQSYVQGIQATLQAEINNCPTMTSVVTAIESITSSLTHSSGSGSASTVTTQDAAISLPIENAGASYKFLLTSSTGSGPNELQLWKGATEAAAITHDVAGDHVDIKMDLKAPTATIPALTVSSIKLGSTDLQTSLSALAPLNAPVFTGSVSGITAAMVGLGSVDNTTDAKKPISTATQNALTLKAPLVDPSFSGTVSGISAAMVGLGSVNNTSDAAKPISTAAQAALNLKAPLAGPIFTGTLKADIIKANEVDLGASLANVQTSLSSLLPKSSPFYSGILQNTDGSFCVSATGGVASTSLSTPSISLNGRDLAQSLATMSIATSAAQADAIAAQITASSATTTANTAFALAQTVNVGSSSFSVPAGLYISDADARDRGNIAQGKPYVDQAGLVQVSQLPPAQYYYDIGNAAFTNGKKGISMASNVSGGGGDITVEAWVNFYQLQQLVVFDLGEPAQNSGNLTFGLTGGGKPYVSVQGQFFTTSLLTPPTKQWIHLGVQLQTYNSVYFVNLLFNGAVYNLGQFTKNSVNWGSVLMIGQQLSGDYPLSGGISNVRVSTSAVYANPWTSVPLFYPLAFPLLAASSTVILLQGRGPSNAKNPLQTITELTQINSLYAPVLYSNIPPSLAGVMDVSSGWLSKTVSWSWTNLTLEAWIKAPGQGQLPVTTPLGILFDTRLPMTSSPSNAVLCYIHQDGTLGLFTPAAGALYSLGTATLPINSWTHVAWVLNSGTWSAFIDGIMVGSKPNSTILAGTSATNIIIGGDAEHMNLTYSKFKGTIFQPMVTAKAKYTTNFVPANDLSIGASSDPVLLFVNPGVSGGFQDLVTGASMTMGGTAITPAVRYLTY